MLDQLNPPRFHQYLSYILTCSQVVIRLRISSTQPVISAAVSSRLPGIPVITLDPGRQKVVLANLMASDETMILPDPSLLKEEEAHTSLSLISFVAPPQPEVVG
ncbi:hypothetical protein PtA15_12A109 [Puccinia triticina]|uniref:Uncharacterized protein n=1 Tax=Puccinia triticina TaxID=208348 RepID=A0ABY7CXU7_9BASI|nr:uncharacterized protein PtA15_12A109 [Puccinia triticina]WAQ90124.1 hypothetical protein PtA15_12A109 [Puccinia triticina]WAR61410.1 hypothetical protein PtB15_12B95 [Puccinia triticina]